MKRASTVGRGGDTVINGSIVPLFAIMTKIIKSTAVCHEEMTDRIVNNAVCQINK